MIIGIDFGTCYSSIAVMQGLLPVDNLTDKIEWRIGSTGVGIPSLFMYSEQKNKELYGIKCLDANPHENPEVIKYMKRLVREDPSNIDKTYQSGGNNYLLRDVIEKYVAFLIKSAKDVAIASGNFSNTDIEAMTITTPIGIADGQMMATDYNRLIKETMVNISGLSDEDVHILGEPVAAAISYLYEDDLKKKMDREQKVLVFDLGGGTLDVTIVKHNPRSMTYEILNKEGELELGGKDWDDALGNIIMKKLGIESISSDVERGAFWDMITELKIALSEREADVKLIQLNGSSQIVQCTRQEFEEGTKHLSDRASTCLKKAVDSLENGIRDIDQIVLVGGSTNMPQIKKMINNSYPEFDSEKIHLYKPSKAIARGAAIFAKLHMKSDTNIPSQPKVIDSTSYSYGFESHHNGSEISQIYNVILKGTKFDENHRIYRKTDSFVAMKNDQTSIKFTIYESQWSGKNTVGDGQINEYDLEESRWMDLGNGETQNGMEVTVQIPPEFLGRARSYSTFVIFDLDQDGVLDITIVDKDNNKIGFTTNR